MIELEYAQLNGIEVRDMVELDYEEPLYQGTLWMDDRAVGTFCEAPDEPMKVEIESVVQEELDRRVSEYLAAVSEDGEELDREVFFLDLIQLQLYLEMFKEGEAEGYPVLIVSYREDSVDYYSAEDLQQMEQIVRENNLEQYQVFSDEEDFIISC